jgi:hypothetical protein
MAKKWSDVAASTAFQALSYEEQEEARRQYFEEVVAPRVPTEDIDLVRGQFLADTTIKRPQPVDNTQIDYGDAATSMQGTPPPADSRGLIARLSDALKPAPKPSVMEGFQPTPQQRQAEIDQRLKLGAGPISQQTVQQAADVRAGRAKTADPLVAKVAQSMEQQNTPTIEGLVQRTNNPVVQEMVRDEKAAEFRSVGEWAIDTLSGLSQGAVSLPQLPINFIAPSSEIAETLRQTQKEWQAAESDVLKAQREQLRQRVQQEEGFLGKYYVTVKQMIDSPALTISEAAKQVPMFLGVLGAARLGAAAAGAGVNVAGRVSPTVALSDAISGGAIQAGARAAGSTAGGVGASMVMAGGDAAGGVYEKLTDPKQTPMSVWEKNEDFQQLVAQGKTADQAIEEIATTKARMAALVTAPLGLLGFAGAEAAIASRGLGRATREALTLGGAGRLVAKDLAGEQLEEGGTQFGGNVIARTVDPNVKLTEGVPEAMGQALVTSAPFSVLGAASRAQEAAQIGQPTNFTPPGSPTQRAGMVDIVIPVPDAPITIGDTNASTASQPGAAPTAGAGREDPLALGSVDVAGRDLDSAAGLPGGALGGIRAGDRQDDALRGGVPERLASLTDTSPIPRASDADLLARTEAAIAGNNNAVAQPTEQWFGRKGDGYVTEADANQALPGRKRMFPSLDWKIEQMPSGKYRLAGYSQETDLGTQAPQAQQAEAQGAQQLQAVGTAPSGTAAGAAPAQAGATLELSGAERAGLKLALPAPATTLGSVRTALAKQRGVEVDAIPVSELNDSQRVASAVGRLFGNTVTFLRATKGDPQQMPNGMVNRMGGKHIFVASNTDDAPLTVTMHEAYHGLPAARRKQLNAALLETFASDRKADFQTEFGYDDAKFEEEAPAMIAQAVSKRADFWEELRTKMGNKEFGEVAKVILDKLTQIVTGAKKEYGDAFVSKYIKDVERARGLLTDAYAEAMRAQGMQADVVASDRSMNTRLQQRIDADFDAAVAEYSALPEADGGKLIDTDLVRELSPEYRADRTRAAEVHDAASNMTQRMFEARVDSAPPKSEILFMAGGGGAGKSSAKDLLARVQESAHTVLDGTLSSYDKAKRNVERALSKGHRVAIAYIYREPVEALQNGVLSRAMKTRRAVPLDALVKGHSGSSEVVRKLQAEFGDNPNFAIYAIDNSRGAGKTALVPLESITPVIKSGLKERLLNATETEYQAGRIDDGIYRATLEGFPDAAGEARGPALAQENGRPFSGSVQERGGSVGSRDPVDEPAMSERAGRYRYEKDNKGRITFTKDVDRVRFLARDAKPSKVDGESITFKAEDAAKVIKALETEPKVDKSIATAIKKKLKLTDEELASTSLEYQTGEPKDRAFVAPLKGGIPEVVKFLEDRRRASGLRLLDIANPEDQDLAAKLMAAETLAAIRSAGNALEWYDETIARTLAMAAVKYPELQSDRNAQMIFRLAMAITSQGLNVENNLKFTMRQYDTYRKTGKYPEVGEGDSASVMVGNFKLANALIEEMGIDLFRQFLVTPFTIGELNRAGFEPGGELIDEMVLGSSVFGPKIGFGFYSNLNGNFEPVTMDMWFMRTIGRLTGSLRAFDAEKFSAQLSRLRGALDQTGTDGVYADQFDAELVARAREDQDAAIELARQVGKAHEKDFKNNRAEFDAGTRKKSQLVLASDTMVQSLDKPRDVPASGGERRLLREVVRKAVAQVEKAYGQRIPPAAMQALIWYPEQELYKAMGVKLSVTSQDYAGATEKVLKQEGYDEQRLRTAAESGSRSIRQTNAADVGQGSQGAGQEAGRSGPLETGERERFIRDRYERTQLAQERLDPKRRAVVFEVAPDPNNAALTETWRSLDPAQRLAISDRVARTIVPRVLAEFNTDGILAEQVGSYLDDTNPSFALLLNKGDPVEISKMLGFVLAQDSMVVVSPKEFKGGDKNVALLIQVGDKTPQEIEAIYNQLREIEVNGEKPIGGQSYANGGMTVLNFSDVPTSELAILVDQKLNKAYSVLTREVFAAFPSKQEYDYASSTNDGRGSRAVLRQRARDLRSEATAALEQELRAEGIEFSNRSDATSAAGVGRSTEEEVRGVIPEYGAPREGATSAVGYHYSRQSRTTLLSTAYGTGLKGAEMDRLRDADPRLRNRTYFYLDRGTGINPEAGVGGFAHRVRLQNLYDMDADSQRLARNNRGANAFELAVMNAGFDGYMTRDAGPSGVAVLLGKHMVGVQQLGNQTRMRTDDIVPPAERVLSDAEKIAANRSLPSGRMDGAEWSRMIKAMMPEVYAQFEDSPVWSSTAPMYKDELARKLGEENNIAASERRRLPKVSPQSALEADIRNGARALTRAINRLRADPSYGLNPEPVVLGRLPHVMNMLGASTQDLQIAPSIIRKVFVDKHAEEFASITPEQFVRGLYRPALVLQSRQSANEKELVLPMTGDIGAIFVPITVADSNSRSNAYINSAYQRRIVDPGDRNADTILRRINEGAARYVDLAMAKPALTGRPDVGVVDESGSQRSGPVPVTPSSASTSQMLSQAGRPFNKFFTPWPAVAPKLRSMIADRKVKSDMDLIRWIGDNYRAESSPEGLADTPAFSNRAQTQTPEFKRWFGDSKVVDADGQPLVVYHGTTRDFSVFRGDAPKGTSAPNATDRLGFFFTTRTDNAGDYANTSGANVIPAYLSIQNPLEITVDKWRTMSNSSRGYVTVRKLLEKARSNGHDGFVVKGRTVTWWIAFNSQQIKSAIGNRGTFDPDNPDITASNRRQRLSVIGSRFTLPAPSMTDDSRRALQDDALRMKRVLDAVREQGGTVGEAQNFYDANTLMPGRIQAAMDDFKNNVMQPMIDKAVRYDIDLDELALYAYAKHAEERNDYIASINQRMPDGGSGMKTADANTILQQVQSGPKAQQYEELHRDLMTIASTTRQIMLAEGLITQDEFTALDGAYQNYIPLRGLENVDDEGRMRPGVGRGVNIRGKETIRAMGRRSRASDLIENVIRDYERVVMRVEKNDVGKVLLDFVLSNPDPDLWDVDVERTKPAFNKATGLVQYTKQIEKGDDTIGVKVGGQQIYIKLADPDLARALRQAWKDETSGFERAVVAMSGWWNNWMRNMLTRYNPAFAAINIPRDALWSGTTAALAELGPKGLARYLASYGAALVQSSKSELGAQTSQLYQEFRNAGGITGGFYIRGLEDIEKDLRNEMLAAGAKPRGAIERIKAARTYKLARLTLKALEFLGAASENATRFALYSAAKQSGRTRVQAALLAKNGTTNFNRKGEWGGALNNLYLFYNAAVQGTAQFARVLRSPAVAGAMAGVAGIGAMLAFYGASAGGEDDDGEAYWDKIPGYVKERNMVIMLPPGEPLADGIQRVGKRGRYFTIPVQFGFNIFPNLGYVIADSVRNQEDPRRGLTPTKAALHMTSVVFGSINPFGGSFDPTDGVQVLLAAMPTIADLPIQLVSERNTFGTRSSPERSPFDTKPDSERMFTSSQGTVPAKIAAALNRLGGGNEAKPGSVAGVETSVTPGTIQTLISATTGGLGSFIEQMGSSILAMTGDDKDIKAAKIPVLNKFYGEVDEAANIRSAGERSREIGKVVDEVKQQARVGLEPKLTDDEKRLLGLASLADAYDNAISQMRKAEIQVIRDEKMTEAQKTLERRKILVARDQMATEVNREYLKSLEAPRKP